MSSSVDEVIKTINKNMKGNFVTKGMPQYDYKRIPFTSPRLNYMSFGGIPIGKIVEFYGENHGGKALSLDCDILTPTGYKKMRDIEVGDSVIDGNGKTTKVVGVYPQGIKPMYRITFSDHTSIECSDEHLWQVTYHGPHGTKTHVLDTKTIANSYVKIRSNGRNSFVYSVDTPIITDIDQTIDLPIDPYLLGVLLGDGCLGGVGIGLSLSDSDVVDTVSDLIDDWGLYLKYNGGVDYRIAHTENPYKAVHDRGTSLRKELDKLGLCCKSVDKHIPSMYLYTSIENRIRLLQGLYDTDGYTSKSGAANFNTSSSQLSDDFAFLVRSLGGIDMVTSSIGQYRNADGELIDCNISFGHHIVFRNGIIPCTSHKHLSRYQAIRNGMYFRKIVNVERIADAECQCIKVESDCHTFVIENVTVTHNTTTALDVVANYQNMEGAKGVLYCDIENSLDPVWATKLGVRLDDENFYIIQPESQGAETIFDQIIQLMETGDIGLVVIDSLGAMMSNQAYEKSLEEKTYGGISMALTGFGKKAEMLCHKYDCTIIGINQERMDMNSPYGGKKTTGGEGWKYLCSVRMEFRMGKYIDDKGNDLSRGAENPAGNYVLVSMTKNKTCSPTRRVGFYTINYLTGIDYLKDLVEVAIKYGIIDKAGAWFSIIDSETGELIEKLQGQAKVYEYLEDENHIETLKMIEQYIERQIFEED